jgi:molybdopterin-guanine dinucleotide biosynthesis protein A
MTIHSSQLIGAYVLAGGKSRRMGSNKAFTTVGGRTFLDLTAETLQKAFGSPPTLVVSSINHEEFIVHGHPFPVLRDVVEGLGPVSGLVTALGANPCEFTAVAAIDMPLISAETFRSLADQVIESDRLGACLRVADRIEPFPAIFRTKPALEVLSQGIEADEIYSPTYLMERLEALMVDVSECSLDVGSLKNINDPWELEQVNKEL